MSLEDRLLKLDKVGAETCKVATWLSQIPFGWSDAGFFRTVTCCVIKLTGYIMVFQGGCFLEHWVYTKSIMGVVVKSPQPRISTEQCSVLSLCPQLGWVMGGGGGAVSRGSNSRVSCMSRSPWGLLTVGQTEPHPSPIKVEPLGTGIFFFFNNLSKNVFLQKQGCFHHCSAVLKNHGIILDAVTLSNLQTLFTFCQLS